MCKIHAVDKLYFQQNRQIPSEQNQNQNHELKHQIHQINEKMKSSFISLENLWTAMSEIPAVERSLQEATSSNA